MNILSFRCLPLVFPSIFLTLLPETLTFPLSFSRKFSLPFFFALLFLFPETSLRNSIFFFFSSLLRPFLSPETPLTSSIFFLSRNALLFFEFSFSPKNPFSSSPFSFFLPKLSKSSPPSPHWKCRLVVSGSAPPTVEGSLSVVGGLFGGSAAASGSGGGSTFSEFSETKNGNGFSSEEELRSDPAYLSYYYSNVNLNSRLPPPLLSKEDWRFAQRLKGGSSVLGGIGDRRKGNRVDDGSSSSLFSMPPGFNARKLETELESDKGHGSAEWGGDGLIGLPGLGLGSKHKSLAEIFQDDLGQITRRSLP